MSVWPDSCDWSGETVVLASVTGGEVDAVILLVP